MRSALCVLGVMADAARLFGQEAEQRANELMNSAGLQAIADGNQPFVWPPSIEQKILMISPFRVDSQGLATVKGNGVAAYDLFHFTSFTPSYQGSYIHVRIGTS